MYASLNKMLRENRHYPLLWVEQLFAYKRRNVHMFLWSRVLGRHSALSCIIFLQRVSLWLQFLQGFLRRAKSSKPLPLSAIFSAKLLTQYLCLSFRKTTLLDQDCS